MPVTSLGVSAGVSFDVTDAWEKKLESHIKKEGGHVAYDTSRAIVKQAKINVPKRTKTLMRSIHRERIANGHHAIVVDAENQQGDMYGRYVEYGTRYMRAQPFLIPAIQGQRRKFRKDMKKILRPPKGR